MRDSKFRNPRILYRTGAEVLMQRKKNSRFVYNVDTEVSFVLYVTARGLERVFRVAEIDIPSCFLFGNSAFMLQTCHLVHSPAVSSFISFNIPHY